MREKKVDPAKIPADQLPPELRELAPQERVDAVEKAAAERATLQAKILELNRQREAHAAEQQRQIIAGAQTLDEALVETTREQAAALGDRFGN